MLKVAVNRGNYAFDSLWRKDVYYIDFHKAEPAEETPVEADTTSDAAATDASRLLDETVAEGA